MGGRVAQQGMQGFGAGIGLHNIGRQARRTTGSGSVSPLRIARGRRKTFMSPIGQAKEYGSAPSRSLAKA